MLLSKLKGKSKISANCFEHTVFSKIKYTKNRYLNMLGQTAAWSSGKNAAIVIDMVSVQNLLAPFFLCSWERNFTALFLLSDLGKQF